MSNNIYEDRVFVSICVVALLIGIGASAYWVAEFLTYEDQWICDRFLFTAEDWRVLSISTIGLNQAEHECWLHASDLPSPIIRCDVDETAAFIVFTTVSENNGSSTERNYRANKEEDCQSWVRQRVKRVW